MKSAHRLDGRVAIVTGAARGMGRSHAKLLASLGACVVVNDLATAQEDSADSVVAEIVAAGGSAASNSDDISKPQGASRLVAEAVETFGRLDIVVNNAGVLDLVAFADTTDDSMDRTMRVNAFGPFYVTRAAWPYLCKSGSARVIMVSSSAGPFGWPDRAAYSLSKAGVIGLARALAVEGAPYGIHVNTLVPSALTRMSSPATLAALERAGSFPNGETDLEALRDRSAGQVSPAVAWLSHGDCSLNGEIIFAARGRVARIVIGLCPGVTAENLNADMLFALESQIMDTEGMSLADQGKLAS